MRYSLCDGWEFTPQWNEEFLAGHGEAQGIRLPHTCRELPLHCIDPDDYQMLCGYRRRLDIPAGLAGKLDTSENPAVPPFGFVVDYLTYGGLYREA